MNFIVSFILIGLTLTTHFISACFITNCPPGGKRSLVDKSTELTRECTRCGPIGVLGKVGQCFGPNICCGKGIGCQINNSISKVCRKENNSRIPCFIDGPKCGSSNTGICVPNSGLCCETDRCYEDRSCLEQFKKQKEQKIKTCQDEDSEQFPFMKSL